MVLNCWSSKRVAGPFILFVKFMELSSLNLWSISSLAIAFLIASIVQVPGGAEQCNTVFLARLSRAEPFAIN